MDGVGSVISAALAKKPKVTQNITTQETAKIIGDLFK